jgi:hypothetical protein
MSADGATAALLRHHLGDIAAEATMEWGIVDKVINKRPEDPAALKVV